MRIRNETRVRACALQLLYGWDLRSEAALETFGSDPAALWPQARLASDLRTRAVALAAAVVRERASLDSTLAAATENWRLERLGVVERNVLRLAALELARAETPAKVVIAEAVRLARWFGGSQAPAFVNGVLDRVARETGRL
jgi:N utilization substance protein B